MPSDLFSGSHSPTEPKDLAIPWNRFKEMYTLKWIMFEQYKFTTIYILFDKKSNLLLSIEKERGSRGHETLNTIEIGR